MLLLLSPGGACTHVKNPWAVVYIGYVSAATDDVYSYAEMDVDQVVAIRLNSNEIETNCYSNGSGGSNRRGLTPPRRAIG